VLKEFRTLLEEMGILVALSDPAQEADRIWDNATRHGEDCIFFNLLAAAS